MSGQHQQHHNYNYVPIEQQAAIQQRTLPQLLRCSSLVNKTMTGYPSGHSNDADMFSVQPRTTFHHPQQPLVLKPRHNTQQASASSELLSHSQQGQYKSAVATISGVENSQPPMLVQSSYLNSSAMSQANGCPSNGASPNLNQVHIYSSTVENQHQQWVRSSCQEASPQMYTPASTPSSAHLDSVFGAPSSSAIASPYYSFPPVLLNNLPMTPSTQRLLSTGSSGDLSPFSNPSSVIINSLESNDASNYCGRDNLFENLSNGDYLSLH